MLSKIVLVFLLGMVVLAMVGKWIFPDKGRKTLAKPAKCPRCGRYVIGKGSCDCDAPRKG